MHQEKTNAGEVNSDFLPSLHLRRREIGVVVQRGETSNEC